MLLITKIIVILWISAVVSMHVIWWLRDKRRRKRLKEMVNKFDGPPTIPFVGNALAFFTFFTFSTDVVKLISQLYRKFHGRSFRIWYLNKPYIFLYHPRDINIASKQLETDNLQHFFIDLVGRGIVTTNAEKWKEKRHILSSAFNTTAISTDFLHIFYRSSQATLVKIRTEVDEGVPFDVYPFMFQSSLRMIYETAFGVCCDKEEEHFSTFGQNIMGGIKLITRRMARPWLYPSFMFKFYVRVKGQMNLFQDIRNFHMRLLEEELKRLETKRSQSDSTGKSMIELIIDKNYDKYITADDVADETLTLLLAGTETNALTISFTLLMLAMKPDIQEQVYRELVNVFANEDRQPTSRDLHKLVFLEQCIKESLRKFSVLPITVRRAVTDIRLTEDLIIPSGANVTLPLHRVHHDPDIYPNPDDWDPHNFDPEREADRPLHTFIPFGTGPRKCIGHKYAMIATKAMISSIVRQYELKTTQTHVDLYYEIMMKSRNGYHIQLYSRNKE